MKKFLIFLTVATLALCLAAGITACDDKSQTVRNLFACNDDGMTYSDLNLGDFYYKPSADAEGDYPDVNSVVFQVQYEDGSTVQADKNDPDFKLSGITLNGTPVQNEPEFYDAGLWTYEFSYKGATARVYFNILPGTSAGYKIGGIPDSWDYSVMPDLTASVTVSGYGEPLVFSGENANATLYYISFEDYGKLTQSSAQELINASQYYLPFDEGGYYIHAGEYYFFADMAAAGNYAGQLTDLKKVVVNRERLTFTAPENVSLSYYFNSGKGPGNAKISDVGLPYFTVNALNAAGDTVTLTSGEWLDPDEEISAGTPDKKYRISLIPTTDESDYYADNLVAECTVNAVKGYLGADTDQFVFDDSASLTLNRTYDTGAYADNGGLDFFNSGLATNDDIMVYEFFRMVDVKDEAGKKLPVYIEGIDDPVYAGDADASAKVVRVSYSTGTYSYRIVLNGVPAAGDYTFTVSLVDDVNFRWGDYSRDYGSLPITLNYTVTGNVS